MTRDQTRDDLAVYVQTFIFPAAFLLLPGAMDTLEAQAMLLAIGLQESRFTHRHQIGGPAHGWWQFEQRGGVRGVLTHRASAAPLAVVCGALRYPVRTPGGELADLELYDAIEHNDVLACCVARLLLWTLPDALPSRAEPELAWLQYLDAWRPGKPHRASWEAFYARAWDLVQP